MTTTSSGSRAPVIVSGEDDDDVPIYFRVLYGPYDETGPNELYWCVIKTKTDRSDISGRAYKKVSPPLFKQQPSHRLCSGFVWVGNTLYVLGGKDSIYEDFYADSNCKMRILSPPHCDVFYINTATLCCPEGEEGGGGGNQWKKLDHSMNVPRSSPYAFTINGKIYVMGGVQASPKPEVLDTRRMDEGWRELQDPTDVPGRIDRHEVIDGGKRIVLLCGVVPHVYCYDLEADSWHVYRKDILELRRLPAFLPREAAFLDGILYYLDANWPWFIFGIDVSRWPVDGTAAEPKRVRLPLRESKCEDWDCEWIPKPMVGFLDWIDPLMHLVSLGSGKLAMLWTFQGMKADELSVYCSTMKMSKEEKKQDGSGGGGDFDLVALPLSYSRVLVHGSSLIECIAGFASQTTGQQEDVIKDDGIISAHEDVCQDDSTVSANRKNSTGGSNKKKKNGNKKNMKEKGKNEGKTHTSLSFSFESSSSQTMGQQEDVNEDGDSTVSANRKNSTSGSNKKKNRTKKKGKNEGKWA